METRSVLELKPHPENTAIYGDHADADLIDSVRRLGVLNPLLITYDNRVISGHRRLHAAIDAGLHFVPIVFFPSRDELDILEALIESNRQRKKTGEQEAREARALANIEGVRAKQRMEHSEPGQPVVQVMGKTYTIVGQTMNRSREYVRQAIAAVDAVDKLQSEGKTREAENLRTTLNQSVRKAYERAQDEGYIPPSQPRREPKAQPAEGRHVNLDGWNSLGPESRRLWLTPSLSGSKFNEVNDNIEWALWSWNPVTGCRYDCPYCYARDMAVRFSGGFQPLFWPDRLCAPQFSKVPDDAAMNVGSKNVFVCSMADLFGRWIPTEWIDAVLEAVQNAPQWNFLFLTKFPIRLSEFDFPDNAWVGTTVDCQARVANAESAFRHVEAKVKWLSCEPLLEPLQFDDLSMFQWIVLGGASKSTRTPEWRPPRAWITALEAKAYEAGCMVYEKTNLLPLLRERQYPGQKDDGSQRLPEALRYLPSIEG